jgi:ABC-type glutathione transport system ATPase component
LLLSGPGDVRPGRLRERSDLVVTPDRAVEPPVLTARGIRVVVEGERAGALRRRRALRGLEGFSIDVVPGEVVHLVGDRGSGMVEALEVLSGCRVPDAGRLQIEGRDVPEPGRRAREMWTRIALLAAPPAATSGRRTVIEVVAEDVRRSAPEPVRSIQPGHRARAEEILDAVGVPAEVRARRERDVAGETLALVWLARLEARRPSVVVVGPPGGSPVLDTWDDMASPELVDSVLARLRAESGTALVRGGEHLPSQLDPRERVLMLCGGRVVESLAAGDLGHPLHPGTRALQAGADPVPNRSDFSDPGCPYRERCDRAQDRCAQRMPELTRPLGASHPVACWFPEDPRPGRRSAGAQAGATGAAVRLPPALGDEPTAHEFVEG